MISDILSQAVDDLDHYLSDPFWDRTHNGELRARIIRLRDEAEYIRVVMDAHPCDTPPSEAVVRARIAADPRQARDPRSPHRHSHAGEHAEQEAGER